MPHPTDSGPAPPASPPPPPVPSSPPRRLRRPVDACVVATVVFAPPPGIPQADGELVGAPESFGTAPRSRWCAGNRRSPFRRSWPVSTGPKWAYGERDSDRVLPVWDPGPAGGLEPQ
ncbi:hypothetical protein OG393_27150 [Streptomyces sp. NBC_01216]|uniref:hypothetical protein n=1 Tax=Streptomyces sp. NBC_01216 TaxID=2903778 RepID=UPI002E1192D0|nr:hypothetical protein OG393_27150 [Streptomyces sp. NBC_01216]